MSATFDPNLSTDRDWLRAQLGDTAVVPEAAALQSDELIDAVLGAASDRTAALVSLAEMALAAIARQPVKVAGPELSVDYTGRAETIKYLLGRYATRQQTPTTPAPTTTMQATSTMVPTKARW